MLHIASTQHRGKKVVNQQDALFDGQQCIQSNDFPVTHYQYEREACVLAIADGVSISPQSHLASMTCVKLISEMSQSFPFNAHLIRQVHERLCQKLAKCETYGSSTTVVAAKISTEHLDILNSGDSRAYFISAQGEWRQLSHDHTIINGLIESGEADASTEYAGIYYGLEHCLIADFEEGDFKIHHQSIKFQKGDSLLLCSDGVHDVLGEQQLQKLFNSGCDAEKQVDVWRQDILKKGASDHFSMIFVKNQSSSL